MKIDDKMLNYEISKYLSKSTPSATEKIEESQRIDQQEVEGTAEPERDTIVNISQASREAQKIEEIILSEPDMREDKVADLKQKIDSGKYTIDNKAVAEKMVDAFIDELS